MPLKKPVAAERRMDLASFFCMVGRHGPAVALAVVAVVTVLAGFYIYRTVKGKRRKAACADGAGSPAEEDADASVIQRNQRRSGESTDVSDEGFSDEMEGFGTLRLRHRPAAAPPAAVRAAQTTSEETSRRLAPPAAAGGEVEVKESRPETLELENQEEHQQVLEDKPDDGDVKTGTEENTYQKGDPHTTMKMIFNDAKDVPASLICPREGEKIEGPEEEKAKFSADQPSEVEALPSVQGSSCVGDEGLSGGAREEDEDESHTEEEKQENGPVCDGEEEELRRECSSLPSQRQREDQTSRRVDENSESLFNGPENPSPETGNQPEPHTDVTNDLSVSETAEETSSLPPPTQLSSPSGMFPHPPTCNIPLSSFEQMQKESGDDGSAGVGAESGISSLAVSPDVEAHGNVMDTDPQTEAPDVVLSVVKEQVTEVIFGSVQSSSSQMFHSESIHWTRQQSSASNEDMFGHEIEDSYHRAIDQFAAQVAASVSSFTDRLTDIRSSLTSVVEKTEKTSIKEDSETDVDYERTEISIMEATMDHNEWITDGAPPVLPWLTLSPLDPPKPGQVPSDESSASQGSAAEVPLPSDVHQTGTLFTDEIMEHYKKVVAVQPMPQNVNVTFCVHYSTQSPYQTVAVTGDQPELGNWKEYITLEKVREGHWSTVVSLPTERHVEWKFVLLDKGEVCRWEECGNRLLDTGVGDDVVVHKWWGLA